EALQKQAQRRTAIADATLDEEGKYVKPSGPSRLDGDDGVIILDRGGPGPEGDSGEGSPGAGAALPAATEGDARKKKRKKRPAPAAGAEPKPAGPKSPKRKGEAGGPGLFADDSAPPVRRKKKTKRRNISHAS